MLLPVPGHSFRMRISSLSFSLTGLSLLGTAVAHPYYAQQEGQVQRRQDAQASQRAEAVREAFQFAWNGYYRYAFPHDELHPVTNGYGDSRYVPSEARPDHWNRM